jgi:endonuclease/exonuclease/phosphatase family metal-dependent hydrolase
MVATAVDQIIDSGAQFATFNELCRNQFRAIRSRLAARGWPLEPNHTFGYFHTLRRAPDNGTRHCGEVNTGEYGNAVFSKRPLGPAIRVTLPYAGEVRWGVRDDRGLLCASLRDRPAMSICTTHITVYPAKKPAQVAKVRQVLAGLDAFLIGGDFNMEPARAPFDAFYPASIASPANHDNHGAFHELDDVDPAYPEGTGAGTGAGGHVKIDYLFAPRDRLVQGVPYRLQTHVVPQTCGGPCSDHRPVFGRASLLF